MKKLLHLSALALIGAAACRTAPSARPDYARPLPLGAPALLALEPGERRPELTSTWIERSEVLPALERSIQWTRTDYARQFYPVAGITHERALASLERFRDLLESAGGPEEFDQAVAREFQFFKSAGWDGGGGGVLFTGYCTPILDGRLEPDADYRHPLYGLPTDLEKGPDGTILGQRTTAGLRPYPTRRAIEAGGLLSGQDLELVWLRDAMDAYIAHVNGSAVIELTDGSSMRLGYAGKNGRPYTSLGAELVADGRLRADEVSLARLRRFFREHPDLAPEYLGRNESYVFFTPIEGNPRGSLNVEVTAMRTLATDKTLFPRGALTFVDAELPQPAGGFVDFQQLMLDQDTGGAIRTAGRADIYFGVGPRAEQLAGATLAEGQLYYLFLAR